LERFMTEDVLESVQVITCTLVGASHRHIPPPYSPPEL
jgi:hypothetical protein